MSAVSSPKDQILSLVEKMTLSDAQFQSFNAKIEAKLLETPKAKREELQPELDKIQCIYKEAVLKYQTNLKAQYDLGKRTVEQIKKIENLDQIPSTMETFQKSILPLLQEHQNLENQIRDFERQIVLLLPENTTLIK